MTSTNVFTGMMSTRNSSRVLRPPGGGHTDILGLTSESQAAPVRKNNPRNISSITEGTNCNDFNQSTVTVEKSATVTVEKPATLPVEKPASLPVEKPASLPVEKPASLSVEKPATVTVEETVSTSNEKSAPQVGVPLKANEPAPKELPSSNQASRVRVPPGGFSSGLW